MTTESLRNLYNGVSEDYDIGDFDTFSNKMQNSESRKAFYDQVSTTLDIGDFNTFENKVTIQNPLSSTDTSNISIKTIDPEGDDILNLELNQKNSSETALKNIDNPVDYENNQKVHSTDYGLFQINDLYHDKTSQDLFGKGVGDLSPLENIELASIISKNTYGPSNWVAYKKGAHKQFEGITDEDMITKYGVSPEVINSINKE